MFGTVFGIISVVAVSGLLIFLLYRGWSPLFTPLMCALLLMILSGMNPTVAFPETFMGQFTAMAQVFFLVFISACVIGALYERTGAAQTIAETLYKVIVGKKEGKSRATTGAISCVMVAFLCSYGGLDGFCSVFTLMPIVIMLCKKSGVPRRFVPALLFGGISSAQLGPGSPLTGNNFASVFYETPATSAPIAGILGMILVLALIAQYVIRSVGKAYENGEVFEYGPYEELKMLEKGERPPFVLAIIPLLSIFITYTIMGMELYITLALGALLAIICFFPSLVKVAAKSDAGGNHFFQGGKSLAAALGAGSAQGGNAILMICTGAGFAAIVGATEGLQTIMEGLLSLPIPGLVILALVVTIFTFISGTPGSIMIAAPVFIPLAAQLNMSTEAMHRISVFAQCILDTLPNNGAILIVMAAAGLTLKEGYPAVFKTTVLYMAIGTVFVTALLVIFPALG